jgi:hypothetical protein
MVMLSKISLPGSILFLTLVFGLWLSLAGRPYNGLLFTIHKLVALGMVIVTAAQVYQVFKVTDAPALVIAALVLAGICVVALFATGAWLSIGPQRYDLMLTIHRIALVVVTVTMAAIVYLLKL